VKLTVQHEIDAYERFFNLTKETEGPFHEQNLALRRFLPAYHGYISLEGREPKGRKGYCGYIKIENLLHGRPNGSLIDFRLGLTSIGPDTLPEQYEYCNEKDNKTTSAKFGFRLQGYIIKDNSGLTVEKVSKPMEKV
jgi:hypothetical protein